MTAEEIRNNLAQFTGSEEYHRLSLGKLYFTDGCKYLAEACQCYWLMDIIASYQGKGLDGDTEGFQVWELTKTTGSEAIVICKDGYDTTVRKQIIPYTDFPLNEIKLYCTNGVVLLPSEN